MPQELTRCWSGSASFSIKCARRINTCDAIPWNIVPADKNWQKLYPVAEVVLKTLEELDKKWPGLVTEKFK